MVGWKTTAFEDRGCSVDIGATIDQMNKIIQSKIDADLARDDKALTGTLRWWYENVGMRVPRAWPKNLKLPKLIAKALGLESQDVNVFESYRIESKMPSRTLLGQEL
jgi:hypothetical protein